MGGSPSIDWFVHDRFGLFIHWGIYAVAARHEWVKQRERMTDEQYRPFFDHFEPDLYDPRVWAQEARNAGMRYLVVTTKHHDGFCLWESALTDYTAAHTPWGKGVLVPMVDAFRAESLRIGFYHSLLDWHHPQFPIDGLHPQAEDLALRGSPRDIARYREYLFGQVRELLTKFGRIDLMWFDFSYPQLDWGWARGKGKEDWRSDDLTALVRQLQPHILVNDRLEVGGDVKTPEQYQPVGWVEVGGNRAVWEGCQTLNGSWGYDRDNLDWKPAGMLIRLLIDSVSKGGNLLLNVGPNGRGEMEPRAIERLRAIGEWMRLHARSIYGCTAADHTPPPDCRYTRRGNRLYLHLFTWPFRHVHLPGLAGEVEYAQLLNDASEIKRRIIEPGQEVQNMTIGNIPAGTLTLELPIQPPPVEVPVIELFLRD
ncbi:MAG: alpha-L-fucosidase [Chloroflexi bacterium]|nr:alpha-L-fucosidase [Chloroflexota bacterium]